MGNFMVMNKKMHVHVAVVSWSGYRGCEAARDGWVGYGAVRFGGGGGWMMGGSSGGLAGGWHAGGLEDGR